VRNPQFAFTRESPPFTRENSIDFRECTKIAASSDAQQGSTLYHYRGRNLSHYEIFGPGCTSAAVTLQLRRKYILGQH
jgi:hypothetical protein